MLFKFKVGDRVRIIKSPFPERIGQVAIITKNDILASNECFWNFYVPIGTVGSDLELNLLPQFKADNAYVWYPHSYLELVEDDNQEKGEWTEDLKRLCGLKEKENV